MLDFTPVRNGEVALSELAASLTVEDLRRLSREMVAAMLALLEGAEDADVVFVPQDPEAHDAYAEQENEANLAWTLGHVIVHTTASAEEAAALAAELARGVPPHGRSRYEVPWQTVTTVAQCRHRLEESLRLRLASLEMWPDEPHLDNVYISSRGTAINAVHRFLAGLMHDDSHLGQIDDIIRQARAARA